MGNLPRTAKAVNPVLAEMAARIISRQSATAEQTGRELRAAKRLCGHGEWLPFLAECDLQPRTAQRLMRYASAIESGEVPPGTAFRLALASIADKKALPANTSRVSHLPEVCRVHRWTHGPPAFQVCCRRCGMVVRASTGRPVGSTRWWACIRYRLFPDGWRAVASCRGRTRNGTRNDRSTADSPGVSGGWPSERRCSVYRPWLINRRESHSPRWRAGARASASGGGLILLPGTRVDARRGVGQRKVTATADTRRAALRGGAPRGSCSCRIASGNRFYIPLAGRSPVRSLRGAGDRGGGLPVRVESLERRWRSGNGTTDRSKGTTNGQENSDTKEDGSPHTAA